MEKGPRLSWSKIGDLGGSQHWGMGTLPWAVPGEGHLDALGQLCTSLGKGFLVALGMRCLELVCAAQLGPSWLGCAGGASLQTVVLGLAWNQAERPIWVIIYFSWHVFHRMAAAQVERKNSEC